MQIKVEWNEQYIEWGKLKWKTNQLNTIEIHYNLESSTSGFVLSCFLFVFHTCCVFMNVCFVLLLFCLPFRVLWYVWLRIHCRSAICAGNFTVTVLLRTTRMRFQLLGWVSGVAVLQTNKQTNRVGLKIRLALVRWSGTVSWVLRG